MTIGKIERVPLRDVWRREDRDFTTWLRERIDALEDVVGLGLTDAECEQSAGTFSVDIVARDRTGELVIIENQLEKTDHDHLGKVLTYLTALEAKTAIWIASDPRPEHIKAVTWLNESTPASFYLLKVEAIRILETDDGMPSAAAPLLTLIVGPSEEGRQIGKTRVERGQGAEAMLAFWTALLDRAKYRTLLHSGITPQPQNWVWATAGRSGLKYFYGVRKHDGSSQLYIDLGRAALDEAYALFDYFYSHKSEIESAFGDSLEWDKVEGRQGCYIKKTISIGGHADPDRWDTQQDAMIDAMIRLDRALRPFIEKLP